MLAFKQMPTTFKTFFCLVSLVFSFNNGAVTIDWSGWSRGEAYYQGDVRFHGTFYLALEPTIQVMDGVTVSARVDATHRKRADEFFKKSRWLVSDPEPQSGLFLLYSEQSPKEEWSLFQHSISLSQFYITWQGEFVRFQLGKAPYHFGMGLTYSDSSPVFANWISHVTWLSLYLEYSRFYFQPAVIVREEHRLSPLLTGGISGEKWKVEGLYRHEKFHQVELFGQYEKDFWDTKLSVSYGFSEEHLAAAVEVGADLWFWFKPRVEFKGGYASKNFFFHPNYNVGLFLWNYLMSSSSCSAGKLGSLVGDPAEPLVVGGALGEVDSNEPLVVWGAAGEADSNSRLWIADGCINDVIYFAPKLEFSFLEGNLKAGPQFVTGWQVSDKRFDYELNLGLEYSLETFLTLRAQGGFFHENEITNYGFLVQAAVEF